MDRFAPEPSMSEMGSSTGYAMVRKARGRMRHRCTNRSMQLFALSAIIELLL
jgi:hypothetical protein